MASDMYSDSQSSVKPPASYLGNVYKKTRGDGCDTPLLSSKSDLDNTHAFDGFVVERIELVGGTCARCYKKNDEE